MRVKARYVQKRCADVHSLVPRRVHVTAWPA
jgi:hypothetical protein